MSETNNHSKLLRMVLLAILLALIVLLGLTPVGMIPLGFIYVTVLCVPVVLGTLYMGWKGGLVLGLGFGAVSFWTALTKPSALVSTLMAASPVLTGVMIFLPRLCIPLVAWFVYRRLEKLPEEKAQRGSMVIFSTMAGLLVGLLTVVVLYLLGLFSLPAAGENAVYEVSRNRTLLLIGSLVLLSGIIGLGSGAIMTSRGFRKVIAPHAPAAVASVCGSLTNTVLYLGLMLIFYIACGIDTSGVLALIGGTALIAGLSEALICALLVPPILSAVRKIRLR